MVWSHRPAPRLCRARTGRTRGLVAILLGQQLDQSERDHALLSSVRAVPFDSQEAAFPTRAERMASCDIELRLTFQRLPAVKINRLNEYFCDETGARLVGRLSISTSTARWFLSAASRTFEDDSRQEHLERSSRQHDLSSGVQTLARLSAGTIAGDGRCTDLARRASMLDL